MNQTPISFSKLKIISGIVLVFCVFSCQSLEEKSDGAYEEAKVSKEFSDDSLEMDVEKDRALSTEVKTDKVVVVDSWVKYATAMEKEIKAFEKSIDKLRNVSSSGQKNAKKLTSLESSKQDLQKRLLEYKLEMESNLEKFKAELKVDMIELDEELKKLAESTKTE